MSSGGMEWAYRMIAAHDLDPLGVAVILHLGWRDAPSQLTDTGIARALHQHRSSVRLATAKLQRMGVICRAPAGFWIAVETVKTVTGAADAPRPDPASVDPDAWPVSGQRPVSGHGQSVAMVRPVSGHQNGQSVATMRKEKIEKGSAAGSAKPDQRQPRRLPPNGVGAAAAPVDAAAAAAKLSPFQRKLVREGHGLALDGQHVAAGSSRMLMLQAALSDLERGASSRSCPSPAAAAALVGAVARACENKGAGNARS